MACLFVNLLLHILARLRLDFWYVPNYLCRNGRLTYGLGTGKNVDRPPSTSETAAIILAPRIGVTVLFGIGFIYFCLVLNTFRVWSGATISPNDPHEHERQRSGDTDVFSFTPEQTPLNYFTRSDLPPEDGTGLLAKADGLLGDDKNGLKALVSANSPGETGKERMEEMARRLDNRSTGSTPSMLGLELTPPRPFAAGRMSETPPPMAPLILPFDGMSRAPVTTATQTSPLSIIDPPMGSTNQWLQPVTREPSRPFQRHEQTADLDQPLPPSHSRLASIPEFAGFGTLPWHRRNIDAGDAQVDASGLRSTARGVDNASVERVGGDSAQETKSLSEKKGFMGKLGGLLR